MDLETKAKPMFLNHEEPRVWLLTDLENGPMQCYFYTLHFGRSIVVFSNTSHLQMRMKMADEEGKIILRLFRLLTPPPGWKCPKSFILGLGEPWESESDSET